MKFRLKSCCYMLASGLTLVAVSPGAMATCSADSPYIGSVCFTAVAFCPTGYLAAEGQTIQISSYQALYSLLGNRYGGDGRTTFQLPDLRGRSPIGQGQGPGLTDAPMGSTRGNEKVTLTVAQMPAHSHLATLSPTPGTTVVVNATENAGVSATPSAANNQLAAASTPAARIYAPAGGTQVPLGGVSGGGSGGTIAVQPNGGSQSFDIISPQIALKACIASLGIYPTRD
ncbi:phage tail protein [Brenneria roseae subsp. roseae]|uniref:phage tail protein n=1 Tax=Brenneria roseae TaxID=1509241 RepID=UPI000D620F07|nr:tail fiber protein [Brenneria roseae]PWC19320.1 phage tail protein [Brenneria roseae subsp. roseae]